MDIQPISAATGMAASAAQRETPAQPQQSAGAPAEAPPAAGTLERIVKEIEESVGNNNTNLRFRVDEASGRIVVSVVDKETNQVVRHIPSEEVMKLARVMDRLQGLLFNGKA